MTKSKEMQQRYSSGIYLYLSWKYTSFSTEIKFQYCHKFINYGFFQSYCERTSSTIPVMWTIPIFVIFFSDRQMSTTLDLTVYITLIFAVISNEFLIDIALFDILKISLNWKKLILIALTLTPKNKSIYLKVKGINETACFGFNLYESYQK
jgi:hypothetical protein